MLEWSHAKALCGTHFEDCFFGQHPGDGVYAVVVVHRRINVYVGETSGLGARKRSVFRSRRVVEESFCPDVR